MREENTEVQELKIDRLFYRGSFFPQYIQLCYMIIPQPGCLVTPTLGLDGCAPTGPYPEFDGFTPIGPYPGLNGP